MTRYGGPVGPFDAQDAQDGQDAQDAQDAQGATGYGGSPRYLGIGISPDTKPVDDSVLIEDQWWPGNQWPATHPGATVPGDSDPVRLHQIYKSYTSAAFHNWSPANEAIAFLSEFAAFSSDASGKPDWTVTAKLDVPALALSSADITDELTELIGLIEYRAGVMSEALQQRRTIVGYFQGIMPFTFISHPDTLRLCHYALAVAQFLAYHFKMKHKRPRPSQLHPGLLPPIDVPQHASYPSAHATEAWLVALCLDEVMVDDSGNKIMKTDHTGPPPITRNPLHDMAKRIARNREVLGVHYPSDSKAGEELAIQAFAIMKDCPAAQKLISNAKTHWEKTTKTM